MSLIGPLNGIRVVDMSQGLGGPYCGQLLGDLGAEVIKIEPPEGEIARHEDKIGGGIDILALNRNKRGVVLDLQTSSGREALQDLVKVSDVILYGLGPEVPGDLDYQVFTEMNPRIISASIVGYGSSGPYTNWPPYEYIAEAMSGMASICGEQDGKPILQPVPTAEFTAGGDLAFGIVAALFERESTGVGRRIEVNLLDSCMAVMVMPFQFALLTGMDPMPQGTRDPGTPILGFYRCRDDNYVAVGPGWPRLARVLDMEWMIDDPQWSNPVMRAIMKQAMCDLMEREGFQKADAEDWLALLRAEDIPSSRLNTLDQVITDPQVIHNGAVITMKHQQYGEMRAINCPISIVGTIKGEPTPPPLLGEHTEAILKDVLGYSDARVEGFKL